MKTKITVGESLTFTVVLKPGVSEDQLAADLHAWVAQHYSMKKPRFSGVLGNSGWFTETTTYRPRD